MGVLEMEKEFAEKMKQSLLNLKSEIIGQLMTNNNDFRQIVESMEAKDVVDIASDDIDRKMLDAAGARDVNRLKLIDSALTRIEQGKYGLCMKCGKRIPKERLKAIPYALLCVDCKSADEKRNR
ncbi:putative RNA polymerase-binding protein DksA [Treponema lecithinolyticum ATCC 700332]|jgi:DnaK suppressor protein|uniref:RNA polymerase-binding protein DksA n=2 Tax=Treponema lecithinolyticum TaxID=53418 RepID=A0ABN0NXD9_TRELE|nr:putative RNA polymerase-binding protein DksA [Treponema lecithinolyticum ATCC 700332]